MKLDIYKLIGEYCITIEDGQKVYNLIYPELAAEHCVELDFTGIKVFATPFAVRILYVKAIKAMS